MESIIDLNKKITGYCQEIERLKLDIFHLQNKKKKTSLKNNRGGWFRNGEFYSKPLKIKGNEITVLSIGKYEGRPFMEIEKIDIQNLNTDQSLGHRIPMEVHEIREEMEIHITNHTAISECNNNIANQSLL